MSELKTLKQIEFPLGNDNVSEDNECVNRYQLKQEAIKWVKADKSNYYSKQGKEETILWIKQFFNITEEDMKND